MELFQWASRHANTTNIRIHKFTHTPVHTKQKFKKSTNTDVFNGSKHDIECQKKKGKENDDST